MLYKITWRAVVEFYTIFCDISLGRHESHILHSWYGESSTAVRGDYVKF